MNRRKFHESKYISNKRKFNPGKELPGSGHPGLRPDGQKEKHSSAGTDGSDRPGEGQSEIDTTFTEAYKALQKANIELGINYVQEISASVPVENGIRIKARSIMGTEIPLVQYEPEPLNLTYAYYSTRESLDEARAKFQKVKELTIKLSMVENSAYRLANNIKKTQKRANALKNITIPMYETLTKDITNALEEKDREEFTRLKVIKRMKEKGA